MQTREVLKRYIPGHRDVTGKGLSEMERLASIAERVKTPNCTAEGGCATGAMPRVTADLEEKDAVPDRREKETSRRKRGFATGDKRRQGG